MLALGLFITGVCVVAAVVLLQAIGKDIDQAEKARDDRRDEGQAFGGRFGMRASVQEALSRAVGCGDDPTPVLECTRPAATFLAAAVSTATDRVEYCQEVLAFEVIKGEPRERSRCQAIAIDSRWKVRNLRFCELLLASVIHECEQWVVDGGGSLNTGNASPQPRAE